MKKNVIIFHTDQQRYDSLGCNGNKGAKTPNIDKLAEEGCNFTRHIAANTVCMPSRASLLTGMYVSGHGVSSNGIPLWRRESYKDDKGDILGARFSGNKIMDKVPTIADILGENGYKTAVLGKLHLQPHLADIRHGFYESYTMWDVEETEKDNKPYYGFQEKKLILGHGEAPCGYNRGHYGRWLQKNHPDIAKLVDPGEDANTMSSSDRGDIYLSNLPSKYHNSSWLADEACSYLESGIEDEAPVFMFIGFPDPHHPFSPPKDIANDFLEVEIPKFASKDDMIGGKPKMAMDLMEKNHATTSDIKKAYRNTLASINLIDKSIGKVVDKLKELKLYDDTIIVFTSDHGDFLGDFHMLAKDNFAYNSLLNIPFIIKGANEIKLPKKKNTPMSNVDVIPTILNMLDIEKPKHIQGIDIFSEEGEKNTPMATCYGVVEEQRNLTIYDKKYRYTYYTDSGEEELYNHIEDPMELVNLSYNPSKEIEGVTKELREKLMLKHLKCDSGIFNHYGLW